MKVVWKTDVGRMRSSNQDYVLMPGPKTLCELRAGT